MRFPNSGFQWISWMFSSSFDRTKTNLEVTSARQAARQGDAVNTFNQLAKRAHGSAQTTSLMKRYSDATCGQIFEDKTQNLSKWLIWNCHLSVEYMILCKRYTYIPAILYTSQVSFYGASQLDVFSHVTLALLTGLLNAWFYARSGPPGHDMHDTYFVRSQFIFCMHGIPSRYPRS